MKKIFSLALVLCLMVSVLCIMTFTASAEEPTVPAEPAAGVVIRVSALKNDDTIYYPDEYDFTDFEKGWNAATTLAKGDAMKTNDLKCVIVDLYADWKANEEGEFGDSDGLGFRQSTIYVPEKAVITLNMNGHTIDRDLEENELDGEVICVEKKSDFTINNGTITGGNSDNGAGGIHVQSGASLTLNNVDVIENITDDDDGGGIALYSGASLTMNGGSISNNVNNSFVNCYGAGVCIYNATATFNNVTFFNNQNKCSPLDGTVIYADDNSTVKMDKCQVIDNGTIDDSIGTKGSISLISVGNNSRIDIIGTTFRGNGDAQSNHSSAVINSLISMGYRSHLYIDDCTFTANSAAYMLLTQNSDFDVLNTDFLNNPANVFYGCGRQSIKFTNCTFNNNPASQWKSDTKTFYSFDFLSSDPKVTFIDCTFGNSTFNNRSVATFDYSTSLDSELDNGKRLSSIFSEGSLAMIVAILSLIASSVAICLTVVYNKKIAVPVAADNVEDNDEGEDAE
jgi:hypothetical protein